MDMSQPLSSDLKIYTDLASVFQEKISRACLEGMDRYNIMMGYYSILSSPFDQYVECATSENDANEKKILDICDRVVKDSDYGPKDCLKSILKHLNSDNVRVILQTITLLDTCISNCGQNFLLEVASNDFEKEIRKILTNVKTHPKVSKRLGESLKKWAEGNFKGDPKLSLIPSLYNKLILEGYAFTTTGSDSSNESAKNPLLNIL
ncbi:unnamed protein product, partial [Meganyctiphanes norvegica]